MNGFDIAILVIFAVFIFLSYQKGLILSVFDLCSFIISLILANSFYPIVSKFLRENSGLNELIKNKIVEEMALAQFVEQQGKNIQSEIIRSLNIPDFLTIPLLSNNNPEVYKILGVDIFEDYLASFISSIVLNIISLILVFILVSFSMKLISNMLNIVTKIPVIYSFNKFGGILVGVAHATIVIWVLGIVSTLFFSMPQNYHLYEQLQSSIIAIKFHEHNILNQMILKIFP